MASTVYFWKYSRTYLLYNYYILSKFYFICTDKLSCIISSFWLDLLSTRRLSLFAFKSMYFFLFVRYLYILSLFRSQRYPNQTTLSYFFLGGNLKRRRSISVFVSWDLRLILLLRTKSSLGDIGFSFTLFRDEQICVLLLIEVQLSSRNAGNYGELFL